MELYRQVYKKMDIEEWSLLISTISLLSSHKIDY